MPDAQLSPARLDWLRGFVERGPAPLFATVSGAHLYGFESSDSDFDLRGAFVLPTREVLALSEPEETTTLLDVIDGVELDWVAHDVRKFARMMTRRNGYVLEQLYSPLVVSGGPWLDELRSIGEGCIVKHLHHHYRGFANGQRRLLPKENTVKRLLYCYRVLLTGAHVLRTGRVESNFEVLLADQPVEGLPELIARKREGAEKGKLGASEAETHTDRLDALEAKLHEAFERSTLPEKVTSWEALNDFVVRARLELGGE